MGNHNPNKGIEVLLEIGAKIERTVQIVIGGKLLSCDEPDNWHKKFPPSPNTNLVFTDYLTNVEQRALYHVATILAFPSIADTLPLTILEAMACGLAVIAYDVGGISYQLANQQELLVPAGDKNCFYQTILSVIDRQDYLTRISNENIIRQKMIFSWGKIASSTIDIYENLKSIK